MIIKLSQDTVNFINSFMPVAEDVTFRAVIPDKCALIENPKEDTVFVVATSGKLGFVIALPRANFLKLAEEYIKGSDKPKGEHETTTDNSTDTDSK